MRQGLVFYWDRGAAGKSVVLLDLHQGTGGTDDQSLQPGETFVDNAGKVYVTNLGRGGTAPNEYIDVRINRGTFTGNKAPQPTWDAPDTWPAGEPLTVTVTGNDPDGDEVACMWRNGGIARNTSATSLTFTKNNAGKFTLRALVSDMKGKSTQLSKSITITGALPTTEWTGTTNSFWFEKTNWTSDTQPNAPDAIAVWNDSFTGGNQPGFGNPVIKQLRQIRLEQSLEKDVNLEIEDPNGTLELFEGGIDMAESVQDLTIHGGGLLRLQTDQSWMTSPEAKLTVDTAINLNGKILTVAAQNKTVFSGSINGEGGLKVRDSGTLTLNDGTYSGATVVENGSLEITGTLAHSEVLVDKGGTLGGTGYIGGHTVIANNAKLSPGPKSALGSLTFIANLTLNGDLQVAVDPDHLPNCDQVHVNGALEVKVLGIEGGNAGTVMVANIGGPYAPGQVFQIFNKPLTNGQSKAIDPPLPAPGLLWDNRLATDGSIAVITDISTITFDQWAQDISGLSGTDAAFDADPNKDGMANGLAFALGAPNALYDAKDLLPEWSYIPAHIEDGNQYPGEIIISYPHSQQAAISVSSALEYSTDLASWTAATEDDTHITIDIEEDFYGEGIDRVEVHLLDALAPDGKFLLRLRASP
jgi:autotransporter-associated beta strand protein